MSLTRGRKRGRGVERDKREREEREREKKVLEKVLTRKTKINQTRSTVRLARPGKGRRRRPDRKVEEARLRVPLLSPGDPEGRDDLRHDGAVPRPPEAEDRAAKGQPVGADWMRFLRELRRGEARRPDLVGSA